MAGSIPPTSSFGSFVPSTFIWEAQQIQSSNIDPNLKEVLIRLYQNLNQMCIVLNTKDSALYVQQEFINGQQFFPLPSLNSTTAKAPTMRQVFRIVVNFGTLPNAGTTSVAHGISQPAWIMTRMYATATKSDFSEFIPIPYSSSTLNKNIELNADDTNVNITTAIDYSAYTTCFVILEYMVG